METSTTNFTSDLYQNWTNTTILGFVGNATTQVPVSALQAYYNRMLHISRLFNIYGLLVIHVVGMVSNAVVILTMLSTSQLRGNSSGILIIALAISDFLINILRVFEPVIKSNDTCTFLDYIFRSFAMQTRCVMVLISVNRYALVCHPLKHEKVTNNKSTVIQIVMLSILSLGASVFAALVPHIYSVDDQSCYVYVTNIHHHNIYFYGIIVGFLAAGNLAPMLVTAALTVLTIIQLRRTRSLTRAVKTETKSSQAQRSITKALLGVGIVFILTGIPFLSTYAAYLGMIQQAYRFPKFTENVIAMSYFATFYEVNHSVNFFIYIVYHTKFKSTFFRILKCKCSQLNED